MAENPFLSTPPPMASSSSINVQQQQQQMGYHQHSINNAPPQMMMGYQQQNNMTSPPQPGQNPPPVQSGHGFGIQSPPSQSTHTSLTTAPQPASQWAVSPSSTNFDPFTPAPAPTAAVPESSYAQFGQQSPPPQPQNFAQTNFSPSSNGFGSSPPPPGQNSIGYGSGSYQSPPPNHAVQSIESDPFGGFGASQPHGRQGGQPVNENPFDSYDNSLVQVPSSQAFPSPAPPPPPPQVENHKATPSHPPAQVENQVILHEKNNESQGRELVPVQSRPANDDKARNPYSAEIARRERPPGASPLPKADLVRKRGYALSRISFRTIVMKKWKQAYWVQYGSHTMLWFRAQHDFEEWLNNPYYNQAQRNFLIKLAVNFVHDLYKPNVRGYQVTQCRSKPYGNKMVRQFKLERWMDYGPTIAAAFGSYDPKEVDFLREAIVECMRNTPLDGGIRATGAVRQLREEQNNAPNHSTQDYSNNPSNQAPEPSHTEQHDPSTINGYARPGPARSVASVDDLLSDNNAGFDDTASLPGPTSTALVPVNTPQQSYQAAPPPQQQSHGGYQQPFPSQPQPYQQPQYQQQNPYGGYQQSFPAQQHVQQPPQQGFGQPGQYPMQQPY